MRIAFVSANREQLPDPVVPLGLLAVMTSTPPEHPRELWDLCFERDPGAFVAARLEAFRPQLVAVGLRNLQNSDYTGIEENLRGYEALLAQVRAWGPVPIVIGGAGFSVTPRELMERLRPDFGIAGEGERAFPALLAALQAGGEGLARIPNLHRFVAGELVTNPPPSALLDLDTLPAVDRGPVDPRYAALVGTGNVQTKRGCPLGCEYCTYPLVEGRRHRLRSPERVADEVAALAAQPGTRHLFFVDSVFTLPAAHAKAVCRALIAREVRVPWTCYANPIGFDDELAGLMKAAGCAGLEIGTDSGDDAILQRLRKGFTVAQVRAMHLRCVAHELPDCHTFVLGTTGETTANVARTLDFLAELDPFAAILMMWMDDLEAVEPARSAERRAFRDQVRDLLVDRCKGQPRWIAPQLGINYDRRLLRILRKKGFSGPLWRFIRLNG
ncbi:MAG: radical SAM protein [Pseudomonadota bacterium]